MDLQLVTECSWSNCVCSVPVSIIGHYYLWTLVLGYTPPMAFNQYQAGSMSFSAMCIALWFWWVHLSRQKILENNTVTDFLPKSGYQKVPGTTLVPWKGTFGSSTKWGWLWLVYGGMRSLAQPSLPSLKTTNGFLDLSVHSWKIYAASFYWKFATNQQERVPLESIPSNFLACTTWQQSTRCSWP